MTTGDIVTMTTETAHEVLPRRGTAYSMAGKNTGLPANLLDPLHYPAEAICAGCGQMIRCEHSLSPARWVHQNRMPGEPPAAGTVDAGAGTIVSSLL